jgi:hypothetical protein
MNTNETNDSSAGYLIFFRGQDWDRGMSPEQIQQTMDAVMAWFDGLRRDDRILAGHPLAATGRFLSASKGVVSDGPFVESKEGVAGYILVRADSLEEATDFARACPLLGLNHTIEVRPALTECPIFRRHGRGIDMAAV